MASRSSFRLLIGIATPFWCWDLTFAVLYRSSMNISRGRLEELARRCGRKPNGEIVTSESERQADDYEVGQMARELLKLLPGNRGLTMRQAAARLGVSEAAVHNWVYQKRWIPVVRIGETNYWRNLSN